MRLVVAVANLTLGFVYCSYGVMTILDLKHGWRANGLSHFGLAWIAMAFTCGPHHLEHGIHLALGRTGGPLDLTAVLVGAPAGIGWFLLRVEAVAGGRGDRCPRHGNGGSAVEPALAELRHEHIADDDRQHRDQQRRRERREAEEPGEGLDVGDGKGQYERGERA